MTFTWQCDPSDFTRMGDTARVGIGLKKSAGESDLDTAIRAIVKDAKGPVIPRYLYHNIPPAELTILDFGSGPRAMQARALTELGYGITAFDWEPSENDASKRAQNYWDSVADDIINPHALDYTYDIIYASNVMNVQPTWGCFWATLHTIADSMSPRTLFLCNLAAEPRYKKTTRTGLWDKGRKGDLQLETMLMLAFGNVVRAEKNVPGTSDYVWCNRYWQDMNDEQELEDTLDLLEDGYLTYRGGL